MIEGCLGVLLVIMSGMLAAGGWLAVGLYGMAVGVGWLLFLCLVRGRAVVADCRALARHGAVPARIGRAERRASGDAQVARMELISAGEALREVLADAGLPGETAIEMAELVTEAATRTPEAMAKARQAMLARVDEWCASIVARLDAKEAAQAVEEAGVSLRIRERMLYEAAMGRARRRLRKG